MSENNTGLRHLRKIRLDIIRNKLSRNGYFRLLDMLDRGDYDHFDDLIEKIKNTPEEDSQLTMLDGENIDNLSQEHWGEGNTSHEENKNLHQQNIWMSKRISSLEDKNAKLNAMISSTKTGFQELNEQLHIAITIQKDKDEEIKGLNSQIIELRGKVQQNRIDEKIPGYVDGVKEKLDTDDNYFIKMSNRWAISGGISAIGAIISAFVTFFLKVDFSSINSTELIYVFTRGLLGIALLSWLSYICFSNSKKYTHESIRRKDRQHALMFGKIFLQIYGSTATKEDAINVFKDWNMSGDSAFSEPTEQPPGVQTMFASAMEKLSPKDKNKE